MDSVAQYDTSTLGTPLDTDFMLRENHPRSLDPDWLAHLRARYAEIAARRVPEDAVEDLVQDALGIVLAKGPDAARGAGMDEPPLRWCFTVLRNVIGNWYQKRRHHGDVQALEWADDRPDPLAALTTAERDETVRAAVAELRRAHRRCADWLWSLAQGMKPGALADEARMDRAAFYRRIHRCRGALAEILRRRGVAP